MLLPGQQRPPLPGPAKSTEKLSLCNPGSLPDDVQNHLGGELNAWRIQGPADLGPDARERWESEKPLQCPGIAVGHFEDDKTLSYAVLLVPQSRSGTGYKFVVFSAKAGQSSYGMRVADQSAASEASNYFIHEVEINKFFDEKSKRKFQVQTRQGILLVGSGKIGYEADIYFWAGGKYEGQPVDYQRLVPVHVQR
jgi:hypothetical protein